MMIPDPATGRNGTTGRVVNPHAAAAGMLPAPAFAPELAALIASWLVDSPSARKDREERRESPLVQFNMD